MEKQFQKKLQINNIEMTPQVITSFSIIQDIICVIRNHIDIRFINQRTQQEIGHYGVDSNDSIVNIHSYKNYFIIVTKFSKLLLFNINQLVFPVQQKILHSFQILSSDFSYFEPQQANQPHLENDFNDQKSNSSDMSFEEEDNCQQEQRVLLSITGKLGLTKVMSLIIEDNNINIDHLYQSGQLHTIHNLTSITLLDPKENCIFISNVKNLTKKINLKNGWTIWELNQGSKIAATFLQWFNNNIIVAGYENGFIQIIEQNYGTIIQQIKLSEKAIKAIESYGNNLYATGEDSQTSQLTFDENQNKFSLAEQFSLQNYSINQITKCEFNGKHCLVQGGYTGDLVYYDLLKKEKVHWITTHPQNLVFYYSQKYLGLYQNREILLLNIEDPDNLKLQLRLKSNSYLSFILMYEPNNQIFFNVTEEQQVLSYDYLTGEQHTYIQGVFQTGKIFKKEMVLYQQELNRLLVIDLNNVTNIKQEIKIPMAFVRKISFQADGSHILLDNLQSKQIFLYQFKKQEFKDISFLAKKQEVCYLDFYLETENLLLVKGNNSIQVFNTRYQSLQKLYSKKAESKMIYFDGLFFERENKEHQKSKIVFFKNKKIIKLDLQSQQQEQEIKQQHILYLNMNTFSQVELYIIYDDLLSQIQSHFQRNKKYIK